MAWISFLTSLETTTDRGTEGEGFSSLTISKVKFISKMLGTIHATFK